MIYPNKIKNFRYSQFLNTLPRSSLQIHWISVRFYEMGDILMLFNRQIRWVSALYSKGDCRPLTGLVQVWIVEIWTDKLYRIEYTKCSACTEQIMCTEWTESWLYVIILQFYCRKIVFTNNSFIGMLIFLTFSLKKEENYYRGPPLKSRVFLDAFPNYASFCKLGSFYCKHGSSYCKRLQKEEPLFLLIRHFLYFFHLTSLPSLSVPWVQNMKKSPRLTK